MDRTELFNTVCTILSIGHSKGDDDPIAILNRCVQKAIKMSRGDDFQIPMLSSRNVRVFLEERRTEDLCKLSNRPHRDPALNMYPIWSPKRFKKKMRRTKDIPIIVVNFMGEDYLIDGNRRINYSLETERAVMQVYVCYVR